MKYPAKQLEILKSSLAELGKHFDIANIHPSTLHACVFYQSSEGHKHNWFYQHVSGSGIARGNSISNLADWTKLFEVPNTFLLYPDGCNDSHIETAVNYCLKELQKVIKA